MAWLSLNLTSSTRTSDMLPPTTSPLLDYKCKGKNCFLCISYSGIMAYIYILPTCNSQKITTVLAETCPAMEEDSDKILFKSSCIRPKYFTGLAKKGQSCIEHTYFSQDFLLPRNQIIIIPKAPSHTGKTDTA